MALYWFVVYLKEIYTTSDTSTPNFSISLLVFYCHVTYCKGANQIRNLRSRPGSTFDQLWGQAKSFHTLIFFRTCEVKGFDSHSAGSLPALVSALCIWACMITGFKSVSVVSSVSFTLLYQARRSTELCPQQISTCMVRERQPVWKGVHGVERG